MRSRPCHFPVGAPAFGGAFGCGIGGGAFAGMGVTVAVGGGAAGGFCPAGATATLGVGAGGRDDGFGNAATASSSGRDSGGVRGRTSAAIMKRSVLGIDPRVTVPRGAAFCNSFDCSRISISFEDDE